MNLDLKKYFTPQAIVNSLASLPALKTPTMDLLFSNTQNIPRPIIGYRDLGLPVGNIPVVRRGTASYPLGVTDGSINFIEPQPVSPSEFLKGSDVNNLRMLNESSIQQEINNVFDRLRRSCRATAEALAIQSLTGKINYSMRAEGGALIPYEVEYGTIGDASANVTTKFDAVGAKSSTVIKGLAAILEVLKAQGVDGNDIEILSGFDVFSALCDLAGATSNRSVMEATAAGISVGGGFTVRLFANTYKNLSTGAAVPVVPAKHLLVADKQAGFKMLYAALDSMEAGQQAMPFFATYEEKKDPSGINIIGESKPLPVVNVKGIVKAQVLT